MTKLEQALHHNGITPPLPGWTKTTCHKCSHTRAKSKDRCMSVKVKDGIVTWRCFHCPEKGSDII